MSDALNLTDPKIGLSEISENECRKDFTPSERIAYGKELEQVQRLKAKERQTAVLKRGNENPVVTKRCERDNPRAGKTDYIVGKKLGMSERTYYRAKKVVGSGDKEIIKKMDALSLTDLI